ncbi:universal stress protein [Geodermatophilus sp. SYSU D00079]
MDPTGPTPGGHRVVVGVDGSPGARGALVWATGTATRTGAHLEVLSAFPVELSWADPQLVDPGRVEAVRADTAERARALVAEVRAEVVGGTDVPVEVVVAAGAPAAHLVQRSEGADLLVVGSRGRGAVASTLLGSVALHCTAHARCPVVVVHPVPAPPQPRVVVGLDDTRVAHRALLRAAEEAAGLGVRLEAVAAYRTPEYWSDLYAVTAAPAGLTRDQALARAHEVVGRVLGDRPEGTAPEVAVDVEEGAPADVLVGRAEGAALLVVGSLSRSRLQGMVLGSVALHCVVHARVPVMVVHPEQPATASR